MIHPRTGLAWILCCAAVSAPMTVAADDDLPLFRIPALDAMRPIEVRIVLGYQAPTSLPLQGAQKEEVHFTHRTTSEELKNAFSLKDVRGNWGAWDLSFINQAFSLMSDREKQALHGLILTRVKRLRIDTRELVKPGASQAPWAGKFSLNRDATHGVAAEIQFSDAAFKCASRPHIITVDEKQYEYQPPARGDCTTHTILHETGHAVESDELRRAMIAYDGCMKAYKRDISAMNRFVRARNMKRIMIIDFDAEQRAYISLLKTVDSCIRARDRYRIAVATIPDRTGKDQEMIPVPAMNLTMQFPQVRTPYSDLYKEGGTRRIELYADIYAIWSQSRLKLPDTTDPVLAELAAYFAKGSHLSPCGDEGQACCDARPCSAGLSCIDGACSTGAVTDGPAR